MLKKIILLSFILSIGQAIAGLSHPDPDEVLYKRGVASESKLSKDSIKVLVWNIFKGKKEDFTRDFVAFGRDRDLFLIQEFVTVPNVLSAMDSLNGIEWDAGISFKYGKDSKILSGTMLGSTVPPRRLDLIRSEDVEPIVGTHKVIALGTYKIKDEDDLLAISIHGMNRAGNRAFKDFVSLTLPYINSHKGPVIFAGDFNSLNKTRTEFLLGTMKQYGFQEVKFRNDRRRKSDIKRQYLDYSFVRGLEVVDAEVLGNMYSSDHNAMYFEVRVP